MSILRDYRARLESFNPDAHEIRELVAARDANPDVLQALAVHGWRLSPTLRYVIECSVCGRSVPIGPKTASTGHRMVGKRRALSSPGTEPTVKRKCRASQDESPPAIFRIGERVSSVCELPSSGLDIFGNAMVISRPSSPRRPDQVQFDVVHEHRPWCPWVTTNASRRCAALVQERMDAEEDHERPDVEMACRETLEAVRRLSCA